MPSLDSLPGDQRAVLQLVLSRGRSYDQIAKLLSINPESVRERALAALEQLGPETGIPPEHRASIADYLLGQLSAPEEADEVRDLLASSPSERAWARVVASELAPLAGEPLPEIPTETTAARSEPDAADGADADADADQDGYADEPTDDRDEIPASPPPLPSGPEPARPAPPESSLSPTEPAATADAVRERSRRRDRRREKDDYEDGRSRRTSRLGGMIVIAVVVLIAAVVVVLLVRSGSNSPKQPAAANSTPSTTATTTTTTSSSVASGSSTAAKVIAQINLTAPSSSSKAAGIAEVLDEGGTDGIAIVAQNVPPNTTKPPNAYAVWLYNSPTDAHLLGFVNPGVGSNGRLSTAGNLPSNASQFKDLIVTEETTASPKTPGTIILQGPLTGSSSP